MILRVSLYLLVVFVVLMFAGVSMGLADAYRQPYYIWTGKLPVDESACTLAYDLVVDKGGNEYASPCLAALEDVRVTYKIDGDGQEPLE